MQQLTLKHPAVRAILGLPDKGDPIEGAPSVESPSMQRRIPVQNLSPKELLGVSVHSLHIIQLAEVC